MEKRIILEKRGRPADQIKELNLDLCRSPVIVGLTDEFTALENLSLINVGLITLKGFPKLPNLKKLELSDNRISNGLGYLEGSLKLTHLSLSGNRIKDYETLEPLKNLKNLEVLDLFNNEVTSLHGYRRKVFEMFPTLKYLDEYDENDVEVVSSSDSDSSAESNDYELDGEEVEEEEEKVEEEEEDEEDEGDLALAEIYNDIEDDPVDYVQKEEDELDDLDDLDEIEGEEDDEETEGTAHEAPVEGEESTARGKKRKHDG